MTCRHTQSLLEDFLDDLLSDFDAANLEQHLKKCRSCEQIIEEAKALKANLKELPAPNPGGEYYREATRLIFARTGHLNRTDDTSRLPSSYQTNALQLSEAKTALLRSVAAFAIAVFVLVSAVYIGTKGPNGLATNRFPESKFFVSVDLTELQSADNERLVTAAEQNRIVRGMLLMGAPGSLGRGPILNQILQSIE